MSPRDGLDDVITHPGSAGVFFVHNLDIAAEDAEIAEV
jgi:hypothetical protein